jgi:hypothetical protein
VDSLTFSLPSDAQPQDCDAFFTIAAMDTVVLAQRIIATFALAAQWHFTAVAR